MLQYIWKINKLVAISTNSFAQNYNLQSIMGLLADLPIFFSPVFLVSAWIYWTIKHNDEKKKDLVFIFFSIVFAILTNLLIQQFIVEKRPETFVEPLLDHLPDASFPSDHAAVSIAFLTALYLFGYKRIFWIYLPFVVLMNFSRIAGGIHWFWDVIIGAFIGIFWAFIFKKFSKASFMQKIANFFIRIAKIFKL